MYSKISIIIPTWNEEKNIEPLVKRIDESLKSHDVAYEIVFIDDNSSDDTVFAIMNMAELYPIKGIYLKEGRRGKTQSIMEGLTHCKNKLIAILDADMSFPPEAIGKMVKAINDEQADMVVANRVYTKNIFSKKLVKAYQYILSKALHGLRVDVQSGLKVFKKEIFDRISLETPGAVDLEFLIKARNAGCKITSINVEYHERPGGSRFGLLGAMISLAWTSLKLKIRHPSVIPFGLKQIQRKGMGFHVRGREFISHTDLEHDQSALFRFSWGQVFFLGFVFCLIIVAFYLNWFLTLEVFVAILTVFYFSDLLFNMFLIFRSFSKAPEIVIPNKQVEAETNYDWPSYTILCPLYKEAEVIPQFVGAMSQLDYPKHKLQIMLLLEKDDVQSIAKTRQMQLPSNFDVEIVPDSQPKTKPKACNYGLTKANGEYVVIYDAEDLPDPLQLKKAVLAFANAGDQTICIQAKLNFYNPKQNLLTRVFTAEYSLWFDLVLTGLQSIQGPIPLGGTSNHFKMKHLQEIKGWDAFNVTEDCDLGMRLFKQGYRTAIMDSTTLEEANSDLNNWFRQRSRWIKGYIQTYLVHMRNPGMLIRNWRRPHILTFQLVVGGKVLSLFINPFMWAVTALYFWQRAAVAPFVEPLFPTAIFYMAVLSLVFGNFFYLYYYMIGCAKRGYDDIIKYVFLVPFYWLFMSVAAWKAVYEIIVKPHYWQKTIHGLHLKNSERILAVEPIRNDMSSPKEGPIL